MIYNQQNPPQKQNFKINILLLIISWDFLRESHAKLEMSETK